MGSLVLYIFASYLGFVQILLIFLEVDRIK
jgi:hypothetical protein